MDQSQRYENARAVVAAKLRFLRHVGTYALVMAGLAVVNNLTWGGYQWWLWPAFGWGIGLLSHFLSAFVFDSKSLQRRLIDRELESMDE